MSESISGPVVILNTESPPGACMRSHLLTQVDTAINAGAIREAADAVSALQAPDILRDTMESSYLNREPKFVALEALCNLCGEAVRASTRGRVTTEGCAISGFCEWQLAERLIKEGHNPPADEPHERPIPCAGIDCTAKVALWRTVLGATMTTEIVAGECAVDLRGCGWVARMLGKIERQRLEAPDPERTQDFDGVDINDPRYRRDFGNNPQN